MKLHHCAYTITKGSSNLLQEFCESMGAKLIWEGKDQGREITMEFKNKLSIQFSEINEKPLKSENKQETHLAFESESPKEEVENLTKWFEEKGIKTRKGKWSDIELWIDCPDIFINFVIEVFKK